MRQARAREIVLLSMLGTGAVVTIAEASNGGLPAPRRVLALGLAYVGIAGVATVAPQLGAAFGAAVFLGALVRNGERVSGSVLGAVEGEGPLSSGGARPLAAALPVVGAAVPGAGAVPPPGGASAPPAGQVPGVGPVLAGGLSRILPTAPPAGGYGYRDPEGQGGRHLAIDWFAPAGTQVRAPASGRAVRVSPDPNPGRKATGQVFGGTVSIRDGAGRLWVMRHVTPLVSQGATVTAGQVVATVKDWTGPTHVHLELYGAGSSDREYSPTLAQNPLDVLRRAGVI